MNTRKPMYSLDNELITIDDIRSDVARNNLRRTIEVLRQCPRCEARNAMIRGRPSQGTVFRCNSCQHEWYAQHE